MLLPRNEVRSKKYFSLLDILHVRYLLISGLYATAKWLIRYAGILNQTRKALRMLVSM